MNVVQMQRKEEEEEEQRGDGIAVWDCGSPLYDSFELASLGHVLERHLMALPHSNVALDEIHVSPLSASDGKPPINSKGFFRVVWCTRKKKRSKTRQVRFHGFWTLFVFWRK